jgi:flagellar biosynthesis protein FlhF
MTQRTFLAGSLQDAMQQAKMVLGPHALILNTREIATRSGGRRIEVTAYSENQSPMSEDGELRDIHCAIGELRSLRSSWENSLASHERLRRQLENLVSEIKIQPQAQPSPIIPSIIQSPLPHLPEDIARTLIARAEKQARQQGTTMNASHMVQEIARAIPVAPGVWENPKRTVAALVGPTGVGKTTTVVKLAGLAAFRHNKKVAIISTDAYRIGQANRLKSYSKVMDIPIIEAPNREKLKEAARQLAHMDLILVDTPGHSPWDQNLRQKLYDHIQFADVEMHLVLSATAREQDLRDIAASYAPEQLTSIILTKMDEARNPAAALSATWNNSHGISHTAYGQGVPDDLSTVEPMALAREIVKPDQSSEASSLAMQPVPC